MWLRNDGFSGMSWLFIWVFLVCAVVISFVLKQLVNPFSIGIAIVPAVMVVGRYFGKGAVEVNGPSFRIGKEQ